MDLDQQIQLLISNAPQDGITPQIVAALTPGLKLLALRCQHSQYYILQSLEQGWVLTTLSHQSAAKLEKRVIYAFPSLPDIPASSAGGLDAQVIAVSVPVTHILFQLFALETVDSVIFLEIPGDLSKGTEVSREQMQDLLQQLQPSTRFTLANQLPPDIA